MVEPCPRPVPAMRFFNFRRAMIIDLMELTFLGHHWRRFFPLATGPHRHNRISFEQYVLRRKKTDMQIQFELAMGFLGAKSLRSVFPKLSINQSGEKT